MSSEIGAWLRALPRSAQKAFEAPNPANSSFDEVGRLLAELGGEAFQATPSSCGPRSFREQLGGGVLAHEGAVNHLRPQSPALKFLSKRRKSETSAHTRGCLSAESQATKRSENGHCKGTRRRDQLQNIPFIKAIYVYTHCVKMCIYIYVCVCTSEGQYKLE